MIVRAGLWLRIRTGHSGARGVAGGLKRPIWIPTLRRRIFFGRFGGGVDPHPEE